MRRDVLGAVVPALIFGIATVVLCAPAFNVDLPERERALASACASGAVLLLLLDDARRSP